jgi:hypothetical protein
MEKRCARPPRQLSMLSRIPRWTIKRPVDSPMKKAANCMSLAAFVMRYGGLGSIERWLAALVKYRFVASNKQFRSPVCSPVLTLMPPCSNHHRSIYDQKPRANPSNFSLLARLRCTCHGRDQLGHIDERSAHLKSQNQLCAITAHHTSSCATARTSCYPYPPGVGPRAFDPAPTPYGLLTEHGRFFSLLNSHTDAGVACQDRLALIALLK